MMCALVTVLCNQPEACTPDLGDNQSHYSLNVGVDSTQNHQNSTILDFRNHMYAVYFLSTVAIYGLGRGTQSAASC